MPTLIKKKRCKKKINYNYPVLVIHRSNNHITAQILESHTKKIVFTSTSQGSSALSKSDKSIQVANTIVNYLNDNKISRILLDRNGFVFHGRIKLLVDTIRKNNITI